MVASDEPMAARVASWAVTGGLVGGMLGTVGAGFTRPPAVGTSASLSFIAKSSALTAGELAGVAAVFAATDTFLHQTRGHSPVNGAIAGCAAGSVFGLRSGSFGQAGMGCSVMAMLQLAGGMMLEYSPPSSAGGH